MRGPAATMSRVLLSNIPLAVVIYTDALQREELLSDMETLARDVPVLRSTRFEDLFEVFDKLVVFSPANELEAVGTLAARRDQLLERQVPAVLLLMRGGVGLSALTEETCSGLASWVQGSELDPDMLATVDIEAERERFRIETGLTPREWLEAAKEGRVADSAHERFLTGRARFLEAGP